MLKENLISAIEDLALEMVMKNINVSRELDHYAVNIIKSHKDLLEGNLNKNKEVFVPYLFEAIVGNQIDKLSQEDARLAEKFNAGQKMLEHLLESKYILVPQHIVKKNGNFNIDWSKFDLESHIKMMKESISMMSIQSIDSKLLSKDFYDLSGLMIESKQVKRKLITESGALGCPKQSYDYARKNFDNTAPFIIKALEKEGFIVEEVYDGGSLRRKKHIVGDLDFIVNVKGHKDIGILENCGFENKKFEDVYNFLFGQAVKKGIKETIDPDVIQRKSITQFKNNNMQCDVFMSTPTSLHTKRCYWTGSAPHNVRMMYNGFKKNRLFAFDYLYDKNINKFLVPKNEKQIFNLCGLDYIPPEERY